MPSALHVERLLYCLVVTLLVTAAMPAGSLATGSGGVAAAESAGTAAFTENVYHEQRGDVVEISVSLSGTDTATVRIGDEESSYFATVVLTDADGDGRATALLNTYDATYGASEGDAVTVRDEANDTKPLVVGMHDLTVWPGDDAAGNESSVATMAVSERSTDGVRTWVAPESTELMNRSAIEAAKPSGTLTRNRVVEKNDTLVFELRTSGLEGALAARNESNVTTRFFDFLGSDGVSLVVRNWQGPERKPAYLDVTNASAATVVADSRNDTYYLVVNLRNARVTANDDGVPANSWSLEGEYHANVTLSADSALTADGRETVTAEFEITDAEASFDTPDGTESVYVAPAPNQTVSGVTSLAPGHRVTVVVAGPDGDVRSRTVRVRNGTETPGRFAATFDFGDVPTGTNVTVSVRHDGRSLPVSYRDDAVGGSVIALDASVNLADRGLAEYGVLVENATLSHGGYLAVHRGSADGEVLGRSEYLAPGEEFDQVIHFDRALESNATLVAVAHRTGAGDALGESLGEPYAENGTVVADSVEYATTPETTSTVQTIETTTTARTTSGEEPVREETTRTPEGTTTAIPTEPKSPVEPTPPEVPGFGVGIAVVALLAGALLARNR